MPNAAEHPAWLRAALELALGSARDASAELAVAEKLAFTSARDASAELGVMVEDCEDLKQLVGMGLGCARGWDPGRSVEAWSRLFDAAVAVWCGEVAADGFDRAAETLWSQIRRARNRLSREPDAGRLFVRSLFFGMTVAALGGVQCALARRVAERRSGVASAAKVLEDS